MKLLTFNNNNIIKYFIILCILYYILKLIPSQQINNKDTIIMIAFVLISLIFIDNYQNKISENFEQSNDLNTIPLTQQPTQQQQLITPQQQQQQLITPQQQQQLITQPPQQQQQLITQPPQLIAQQQQQPIVQQQLIAQQRKNNSLIFNYFKLLVDELKNAGVINISDINNMKIKYDARLLTIEELITSLEFIKLNYKPNNKEINSNNNNQINPNNKHINNDNIYNELPQNFYTPIGDKIANDWKNDYAILDTDRWAVPTKDPPICINSSPCKVCESDASNYTTLKNWDNSRYVSDYKINKQWSNNH